MLLSVRAESNQRRAKGAPSTNTWLTPVFIGVAPLDPRFTRGRPPECLACSSGGQNQVGLPFLPRGHRPLPGQKLKSVCAVGTPPTLAEPWQLVRGRGRRSAAHSTTAAPNR